MCNFKDGPVAHAGGRCPDPFDIVPVAFEGVDDRGRNILVGKNAHELHLQRIHFLGLEDLTRVREACLAFLWGDTWIVVDDLRFKLSLGKKVDDEFD